MLERGERIAGRYEVEAELGRGGMAMVYRVRHVQLQSVHALKMLVFQQPGLRDRLLLEGRIQAQIRHPNVIAVTDILEHRGRLGLLMEYADGPTLQTRVDRGPLPLEEALGLAAQILSGVAAAHATGVLHRDLKPGNVLLARTTNGVVPKITDFGIAKVVFQGAPAGSTRSGILMGTPGYMAPEQARDAADVDRRADIYALGAVVYAMLAGAPPFPFDAEEAIAAAAEGRYVPLDQAAPDTPAALVAAVHRALSPDREARPADCAALAAALFAERPALYGVATAEPTGGPLRTEDLPLPMGNQTLVSLDGPEPGATPVTAPETLGPESLQAVAPRASLAVWFVGGGLAAALVVAVGLWAMPPRDPPPAAPIPAEAPTAEAPIADAPAAPAPAVAEPPVPAPGQQPTAAAPVAAPAAADRSNTASAAGTTAPAPEVAAPAAAPEPVATPATVADATPEPVADAAQPPTPEAAPPAAPAVAGSWRGTLNNRPATLKITRQTGESLRAELRLTLGPSEQVYALDGTIDASGRLQLAEHGGDGLVLTGKLDQDALSGTFMKAGQRSALPWSLQR